MSQIILKKDQRKKNQKGIAFSLVLYPVLILVVTYAAANFARAVSGNNQGHILHDSLAAELHARKGVEYAYHEIKNNASISTGEFTTHILNTENNALEHCVDNCPTDSDIPGIVFNHQLSADDFPYLVSRGIDSIDYGALDENGHPLFALKTYCKDNENALYVLALGIHNTVTRLFAMKIEITDMFQYALFNNEDLSLGWQLLNAQGGKIHTNGNILLNDYTIIENVDELKATGKISYAFSPFVHPDDFIDGQVYDPVSGGAVDSHDYTNIYPHLRRPLILPNDTLDRWLWDQENYINKMDGHYAGDRQGLLAFDTATGKFVEWDQESNNLPIWPWPQTPFLNPPFDAGAWDGSSESRAYVYWQQDINCHSTNTCADGTSNNENYYEAMPKINDYYLPNRFGTAYNDRFMYMGRHAPGDPRVTGMQLTDSEKQPEFFAFSESINRNYPSGEDTPYRIEGLAGVFQDDVSTISPPEMNLNSILNKNSDQAFVAAAKEKNGTYYLEVSVNGIPVTDDTDLRFDFDNPYENRSIAPPIECGSDEESLFELRSFIRHVDGLPMTVLRTNMSALKDCAANDSSDWLPENGLYISDVQFIESEGDQRQYYVGAAVYNAGELPQKDGAPNGATFVIHGDLILEGHYNTNARKPSAAIVSDDVFLVSEGFRYPRYLRMPHHHPDYPYAETVVSPINPASAVYITLPEGSGFETDYAFDENGQDGYNYLYDMFPDDENPDEPQMPNFVEGTVEDSSGNNVINYNISLIGPRAWDPHVTEELWNFHSDPGDHLTPPCGGDPLSCWHQNEPVVTGSFIQLGNEFRPLHGPIEPNSRYWDQSYTENPIPFSALSPEPQNLIDNFSGHSAYWVRGRDQSGQSAFGVTEAAPWDLLSFNGEPRKIYDISYLLSSSRPPGDLVFISEILSVELPLNATAASALSGNTWDYHPLALTPDDEILLTQPKEM